MLAAHLGFSVVSGALYLHSLFRQETQQIVDDCVNGSTDGFVLGLCQKGMSAVKGIIIAIFVVTWLVELCAWHLSAASTTPP